MTLKHKKWTQSKRLYNYDVWAIQIYDTTKFISRMLLPPPFHENAFILQFPEKVIIWYKLLNQITKNFANTRKNAKNANVNISSEVHNTFFSMKE